MKTQDEEKGYTEGRYFFYLSEERGDLFDLQPVLKFHMHFIFFFLSGIIWRSMKPSEFDSIANALFVIVSFSCPWLPNWHGAQLQNCRLARGFSVPDCSSVRFWETLYPTHITIYTIHSKVWETGSVVEKPCSGRPASNAAEENTELPEQDFA